MQRTTEMPRAATLADRRDPLELGRALLELRARHPEAALSELADELELRAELERTRTAPDPIRAAADVIAARLGGTVSTRVPVPVVPLEHARRIPSLRAALTGPERPEANGWA